MPSFELRGAATASDGNRLMLRCPRRDDYCWPGGLPAFFPGSSALGNHRGGNVPAFGVWCLGHELLRQPIYLLSSAISKRKLHGHVLRATSD